MEKLIGMIVLVPMLAILAIITVIFTSFINAIIMYLAWNYIAPIYFTTIFQPQFLHIPFVHCWVFLYIIGILFGAKTASVEKK